MKTKMLWEIAMPLAEHLRDEIKSYCQRIEIVGSLRRLKPEVGDIELLASPNFIPDMFGEVIAGQHELIGIDWNAYGQVVKGGAKYIQIALHEGINLDLFICTPPAQWGVLKLIRTGPSEYSHKFVTKKEYGGMLPGHLRVEGGAIWQGDTMLETPEEEDVYRVIGLPFCDPQKRD